MRISGAAATSPGFGVVAARPMGLSSVPSLEPIPVGPLRFEPVDLHMHGVRERRGGHRFAFLDDVPHAFVFGDDPLHFHRRGIHTAAVQGSGASRVQRTKPSGDGSPDMTPREKGYCLEGRSCVDGGREGCAADQKQAPGEGHAPDSIAAALQPDEWGRCSARLHEVVFDLLEEAFSAGRLSTGRVSRNCSRSLRCSRVSRVGILTSDMDVQIAAAAAVQNRRRPGGAI